MICDNNITFHYIIIGNKDDEKNLLYGRLIETLWYNFRNKLRSEFGQEENLTENQGQIHEYIDIMMYYLLKYTEAECIIRSICYYDTR